MGNQRMSYLPKHYNFHRVITANVQVHKLKTHVQYNLYYKHIKIKGLLIKNIGNKTIRNLKD